MAATRDELAVVLQRLGRQQIRFRNITQLAHYVADAVSEKRGGGTPMAYTTLLRSKLYRQQLLLYLAESDGHTDPSEIETLQKTLEIGLLREEVRRLRRYINRMIGDIEDPIITEPPAQSERDVDALCRSVALLIEASNGQLALDSSTGEIVRTWARSRKHRVVVPKGIAKRFVEWQSGLADYSEVNNNGSG